MELEQKQAEIVEQFVNQALKNKDFTLCSVITEATSNPSLFAFSEILDVPNVAELKGTEHSMYFNILRLFAHGTWTDYKCNAASLPALVPEQLLKLKQLTVLTLAETNKMLPYDQLMDQLDITNVRDLEDFLINECMYAGIVTGKLDQWRRCFEVQFAAGRDLRPGQLGNMIHTLAGWLSTSDNLLVAIQDQIKWADAMSESNMHHKKQVEEKLDLLKATLPEKANVDSRRLDEAYLGGLMDFEEDRTARPKRRRSPRH